MLNALVTGASSQLAQCIYQVQLQYYSTMQCIYTTRDLLDITNEKQVLAYFRKYAPIGFLINCAAYTDVEKTESNDAQAFSCNAQGPAILGKVAKQFQTKIIHISSDYIFDGAAKVPYTENSIALPINAYGKFKLMGEKMLYGIYKNVYIIRTSWLYSAFGSNFFTKIAQKCKKKNPIQVINDQVGSPTYAYDLAYAIWQIISIVMRYPQYHQPGIYNYTNMGQASWYDFACAITKAIKAYSTIVPIASTEFASLVQRPSYTVLCKQKIKKAFNICIPSWEESLLQCAQHYQYL